MKPLDHFKHLTIEEKKGHITVGVIAGGVSAEREVSLKTGTKIFEALKKMGYRSVFIDFKNDFTRQLDHIDIAFLALHGRYGEDGTVQGALELLGIPYTGSGVLSSAIVIDKVLTKRLLQCENIPTPPYIAVDRSGLEHMDQIDTTIKSRIGYPVVIKPNREGSTIGITIAEDRKGAAMGIKEAAKHDKVVLIEKFISGRELTVSILGDQPVALPIIEIKPKSGFYDYQSKYTVNMTEYLVPARLEDSLTEGINEYALKSHRLLGCTGISRVDFILDDQNIPYILEVNTMPGMTPTSLVPKAAAAAGISFERLVEIILNFADLKI
ncbi:MAG: D-alanine--D-alanine ligase [Actinomycetia bacterium]|nr:D-alanine--D-alanine ligase [Actinomycetes bacterium]